MANLRAAARAAKRARSVTAEKTDERRTNGIHIAASDAKIHLMFHQADLFDAVEVGQGAPAKSLNLPALIERIADFSPRPRYAFMVLNLIAKAAGGTAVQRAPMSIPRTRFACRSAIGCAIHSFRWQSAMRVA